MAAAVGDKLTSRSLAAPCGNSPPLQSPAMALSDEHQLSEVFFSENLGDWQPLPVWVRWFLRFGYLWSLQQGNRRICILSTPCDSPAAALIALGLMRRRLEVPDAGDLASHMGRLRDLYAKASAYTVLRRVNNKKRFCFGKADADGTLWAHIAGNTSQRFKIIEEFAFDWHVDGEPPVQVTRGAPMALSGILQSLLGNPEAVLKENLARTDSAVCLAGRVAGESQTQEALLAVQFQRGGEIDSLGSLLTVHGWHDGRVSRVTFYNSRTRELDRAVGRPLTVSVDGAAAFARVHAESRFANSDLIAVIPRTSDPDQLEAVAQRLASLSQWYTPEDITRSCIGGAPTGVTAVVLRKD